MHVQSPSKASRTVLGISGSLRRDSYNRRLLEAAGALVPPGMVLHLGEPLGELPHFDEDLERATAGGPPAVRRLREKVAAAEALLIATPEYNQSFPGALKNAIDWLSRPGPEDVLSGKPVAIFGASTGRWGTRLAQAGLRHVLTATGALVLPQPAVFVAQADRHFDERGTLTDGSTLEALRELLRALDAWALRVGDGAAGEAPGRG
ncbi:MAG TPA: NAD(P)H-dependent oxidoreductase [Aggregicoccus sp.]|nr:NAD(P)H-dependent oxidoreductase [Aggregicoccus sp.]